MYPKELIDIELAFAKRVSKLKHIPVEKALFQYTSLYRAFFAESWPPSESDELWQSYLLYIKDKELMTSTYKFLKNRTKERKRPVRTTYSGKPCFVYGIEKDGSLSLHFNNNEGLEPGPLSKEKIPQRMEELKSISKEMKSKHPEVKMVTGDSWLYNIPSYTRLLPEDFLNETITIYDHFTSMNIWGQFLDSSNKVKKAISKDFLNKVKNSRTYEELVKAFPMYPIKVSAQIEIFHKFYGIDK